MDSVSRTIHSRREMVCPDLDTVHSDLVTIVSLAERMDSAFQSIVSLMESICSA